MDEKFDHEEIFKEVRKGAHKDAHLYKFDKAKYDQLRKSGFSYKF